MEYIGTVWVLTRYKNNETNGHVVKITRKRESLEDYVIGLHCNLSRVDDYEILDFDPEACTLAVRMVGTEDTFTYSATLKELFD